MKKYFIVSIVLMLLLSFSIDATAQRRRHKKKKRAPKTEKTESGAFKDRLWYGGNLDLGFYGNGNSSTFSIGLSPMVGYKFTERFSVGPRVSFRYVHLKALSGVGISKKNMWTYSAGIFSRFKIIESIFAHVEYEYENRDVYFVDSRGNVLVGSNGEIETLRQSRDNLYIGAGYSSGGEFRYEFTVLYNVMEDNTTLQQPFIYRVGFTYRF